MSRLDHIEMVRDDTGMRVLSCVAVGDNDERIELPLTGFSFVLESVAKVPAASLQILGHHVRFSS